MSRLVALEHDEPGRRGGAPSWASAANRSRRASKGDRLWQQSLEESCTKEAARRASLSRNDASAPGVRRPSAYEQALAVSARTAAVSTATTPRGPLAGCARPSSEDDEEEGGRVERDDEEEHEEKCRRASVRDRVQRLDATAAAAAQATQRQMEEYAELKRRSLNAAQRERRARIETELATASSAREQAPGAAEEERSAALATLKSLERRDEAELEAELAGHAKRAASADGADGGAASRREAWASEREELVKRLEVAEVG